MVNDMNYEKYRAIIREKLDDFRYNHSLCVAKEAHRLAEMYGADSEKAYLAGLLHDITKNYTENEHLNLFSRFDIILSDIEKKSSKLWHAISGACYCEKELCITDIELISAIRYHTTARKGMSLFEKIIYLADYTSADRDYSDVDVMRKLVDEDISKAMLYALSYTINDLNERKLCVHPDTLEAYNEFAIIVKQRR